MSGYLIACLAVAIALSIVVIFMLAGGLMPEFSATRLGQAILGAVAVAVGLVIGSAAHRRLFAGR